MHYNNGREAKVGDMIVTKCWNGMPQAGVVVKTEPKADTCNLYVQPIRVADQLTLTAKDCLHIDDTGL